MTNFDAEKFIRQFEAGKFGSNIKHPYHIKLLYNAARNNYPIKMDLVDKIKEIPAILIFSAENYLRIESKYAWVDKKGFATLVAFGGHQLVSGCFFGQPEGDYELTNAKITETTRSVEDAIKYVTNPTPAMIKTVSKILYSKLTEQLDKRTL